jgi:anti-anti-sigma factor
MPDTFELTVKRSDGVGILETDGYLNNLGAERVADACDELIDEGFRNILVNLERSRIVTSIGISILIEVLLKMRDLDGAVAFCCASPTVAKTFKIMGLLKASSIYDTEEEAVEAFAAKA